MDVGRWVVVTPPTSLLCKSLPRLWIALSHERSPGKPNRRQLRCASITAPGLLRKRGVRVPKFDGGAPQFTVAATPAAVTDEASETAASADDAPAADAGTDEQA